MYQHGIATIALAEIYGQTKSPAIRSQVERPVRVIMTSQNSKGGWRYFPHQTPDADISVSVFRSCIARREKCGARRAAGSHR